MTTISRARIFIEDDQLLIEHLAVTDRELVIDARRHLERGTGTQPPLDAAETLADYLTTALGVGVRALGAAESRLDLTALDRTVTDLSDRVTATTEQALERLAGAVTAATAPGTGAIPRTVETTLHSLTAQIGDLVAGQDAPVRAAVTESVRAVTEQALAEVQRAVAAQADAVRRALATDTPGSPLHDLKAGLVEGLNASHHRLAAQVAEPGTAIEVDKANTASAAKAPRHGLHSEAATLSVLEELTHTAGDQLEHTGTTAGVIPRCLKGDGVITLTPPPGHPGPPVRIVVEVKDRERAQSLTAWKTLLADAAENRQAIAAVGVVKTPDQMPGQRRLHVLDPTTYLLAYDPANDDRDLLVATYHLLRAHAWHKALTHQPARGVDLGALRAATGDLGNALDAFDTLTRHHNAARRSIDQADKAAATLRADLHSRIDTTRQLLQGHRPTHTGSTAA